jgi:O-antigen/teichoic acid export membrane protein
MLSAACAFLFNLLLARYLAPSEYGAFFVASSTLIILATFATVGMDQIVVRLAAAAKGNSEFLRARAVVKQCVAVVFAGVAVTGIVFSMLSPWLFTTVIRMPMLASLTIPLLLWLFFSSIQRQLAESFRGLGDIRCATLFGGLRNNGIYTAIIMLIGAGLLAATGSMNLRNLCYMAALCSLIVVVIAARNLWRSLTLLRQAASLGFRLYSNDRLSYIIREAWPLWVAVLVITLRMQSMSWFGSAFDTAEHVALLGVAQRFVLLLTMPLIVISAVLPPIISELYTRGETDRLERVVRSLSGIVSLPCVVLLVVLVVFGPYLLGQLFGEFYRDAYLPLVALCAGQLANITTGAWYIVLPMTGKNRETLALSVFMGVFQMLLCWQGATFWGVNGVAIAFCICAVVGNIIGMIVVRHSVGIWTFVSFDHRAMRQCLDMVRSKFKHGARDDQVLGTSADH